MILPKSAYNILGIPQYYYGLTYQDTKLVPTKQRSLEESIGRAPDSGVLLISGTSAPVVNQMFEMNRKVVGISFPELFDARFSDGESDTYPNSPVVLLYGVGLEAAKSKDYSTTILNSIMSFYKSRYTLLLIETPLSISNFQTTYGLIVKNAISIPQKDETAWIA